LWALRQRRNANRMMCLSQNIESGILKEEVAMKLKNTKNVSEMLDEAYDQYKKMFFQQLGVSLVCYISAVILLMLTLGLSLGVMLTTAVLGNSIGSILLYGTIAAFMALLVLGLWQGAASVLAWQVWIGATPSVGIALKRMFGSLLRIASVCLVEVTAAVPVVFLAFQAVVPLDNAEFEMTPGTAVALLVCALILVIGWLLASTWLYFAIPCCVLEKRWHVSAVARSISLVKGDFKTVLSGRLSFWMSTIALQYSLYGVITLSVAAMGMLPSSDSSIYQGISVLQVFLSSIAPLLLAPLPHVFSVLSYANQRIKKNGLDIELELHNRQVALAAGKRELLARQNASGQAGGAYEYPI
jgi:hypothetical protein